MLQIVRGSLSAFADPEHDGWVIIGQPVNPFGDLRVIGFVERGMIKSGGEITDTDKETEVAAYIAHHTPVELIYPSRVRR